MSGATEYQLIVLLPSELREAGRAMARVKEVNKSGNHKDLGKVLADAFNIIEVALWHLTLPDADKKHLMLLCEPPTEAKAPAPPAEEPR